MYLQLALKKGWGGEEFRLMATAKKQILYFNLVGKFTRYLYRLEVE